VSHLIYCHVVFLEEIKLCGVQWTVFTQAALYTDNKSVHSVLYCTCR